MDGILNILKPPGMTSFDVVALIRGILKTKKVGHAGTLDPEAAGVLPLCLGRATRTIEFMSEMDKSYRAELTLGITTDTQDASGNILQTQKVRIPEEKIQNVLQTFIGKYRQIPPMYSAIKVEGKRLYDLAREGISIERKAREVEIFALDIINIRNEKVLFDVTCSKGTYIRTLCADIGDRLQCGGHMSFLLRTRAGIFNLDDALTLEEIVALSQQDRIGSRCIRTDALFQNLIPVTLAEESLRRFSNGVPVIWEAGTLKPGELVRVYDHDRFIGLGEITKKENTLYLKSRKFL